MCQKKLPPRHFVPKCQRRTIVDFIQYVRHPELVSGLQLTFPCHPEFISGSQSTFPCHPELVSGSQSTFPCHPELVSGSQSTFSCHPEFISGSQSTLTEMLKQVQHDVVQVQHDVAQVQHDVTQVSRVGFFPPANNEIPSHTRGGLGRGGLPVTIAE